MMVSRSIKETIVEIIIDSNWYLVYSNYKWQIGTNVFKSSLYDFIEKSKIDIWDGRENGMFEILEEK